MSNFTQFEIFRCDFSIPRLLSQKKGLAIIFFSLISIASLILCYSYTKNLRRSIEVNAQKRSFQDLGLENLSVNFPYDDELLLDTIGCKIPRSDIFNSKLEPLMNHLHEKIRRPYCKFIDNEYKPSLIESDDDSLFVVPNAIHFYKKDKKSDLKCSFAPFWKDGPDNANYVKYGEKTYFVDHITVPPSVEFVRVQCYVDGRSVYTDFHAFVPKNPKPIAPSMSRLNVLIYGMDALSRANFHRQMPRTEKLLEKLHFTEYLGYNKLADNTFPNLIPFLTGHSVDELKSLCWPTSNSYFDNCPFIWNKYKNAGYTTAYVEEQNYLSLFRFERAGFKKSPTDHYYYTFDRDASSATSHTYMEATKLCLGRRFSAEVQLNYATKFTSSLRNESFFAFFWEVSLSHDDLNLPSIGDTFHEDFFSHIHKLGYTESSVIVFMSDHGIRFGKILETDEGYMEERLPLFQVSFPSWFSVLYPLAYHNFLINSRRLTTHFDTYEMLKDLSDLQNIENQKILQRTSDLKAAELPRGISLFLPIPETRTCQQAGIPDNYCTCLKPSHNISTKSQIANKTAQFLVSTINKMLKKYSNCSKLTLASIKSAKYITITNQSNKRILITILTKPGNAIFEGMVYYDDEKKTDMKIIGTISRINQYGSQSKCVHEPKMKLYCYCI